MPITFNEIPSDIRANFVAIEFDPTQSNQGVSQKPFKALLIGGRTSAGTVAELTPTRVTSANDVAGGCGVGSTLHNLAQRYFGSGGTFVETWFVSLDDDGAGIATQKTITLTGAQTAAGTIYLYVAGRRLRVPVSSDTGVDTLTVIAARVRDYINALTELPVTATAAAGVVTVTAKNDGETGNDIDLRVNYNPGEFGPPGLSIAFAQTVAGANNPDISSVWAAIGPEQYDVIACAYDDLANFNALDAELALRFGPLTQDDGIAFIGKRGTFATCTAFGSARNSLHVSMMCADNAPNPPLEWAGAVAGTAARFGQSDCSKPLHQRELVGILAPALSDRWTFDERNMLAFDGCSSFVVDAGGKVRLDALITTYQQNAIGADDIAYLWVVWRMTQSFLRYSFRTWWELRYPQAKLSSDETFAVSGQQIVTPKVGEAEALAWFDQMLLLGHVQNREAFKAALVVEVDPTDGTRLNFLLPPKLMGQLIVTAVKLAFQVP